MLKRAVLAATLFASLSAAAFGGSDLACRTGEEPLLTAGPAGGNAIGLAAPAGPRRLDLREWQICFTCAGLPVLRLTLTDSQSGEAAWITGGVTTCGPPDAPVAQRHCLTGAAVQVGSHEAGRCRFPPDTTLAVLWTSLTGSVPPEISGPWWAYRPSAQ